MYNLTSYECLELHLERLLFVMIVLKFVCTSNWYSVNIETFMPLMMMIVNDDVCLSITTRL